MATRVSGTRSLSPQSGVVSSITSGVNSSITESNGRVDISGNVTNIVTTGTNVTGIFNVTNTTPTTDPTNGAAHVAGGLGVEGDVRVGGFIYGRIAQANTATTSSQLTIVNTNENQKYYPIFTDNDGLIQYGAVIYADNRNVDSSVGGLTYNPGTGILTTEKLAVESSTPSTSPVTGAFTLSGGAGILGDIYVQGDVVPGGDLLSNLGSLGARWSDAYLDNVYAKTLTSRGTDNISITPAGGTVDIFGDIRVRGENPIGTAPVVTNILYVTMDGDDTNDGRAEDAGRACRTICGAVNSPYYQSGTQIKVAAGFYLEDNPIQLKPYTSIVGSDLRTCSIEPINKTQDLFHMNSGCYLAFMQFLNGRSGLLPGDYAAGFNRGAFATSFPPLKGDERIDLFHSPYIQNCTNQSGPWLKDGTMFVPNQTVQVPAAVGTGTWISNTTTIVVTAGQGTITQGMSINAGAQNPGFFDARTLLLASKPFLQEQIVAYIDNQIDIYGNTIGSIWYNFDYSREFCFRDVGILVENVAYDTSFGGNEKSIESGLAYYNGVVSRIAGQESQTTAAIDYLRSLCLNVIDNVQCTDLLGGTGKYQQVINIVLTQGSICSDSINNLFDIIMTIIDNGPNSAPTLYNSAGPDAAFVSAEILLQANRAFIQENTLNYINWFLVQPQPPNYLPYNRIKCRRDTGIIIDSLALDLLYPTANDSQTTFSGLQYWSQDSYVTGVLEEITTTTNAIKYLRDLSIKVIQNFTTATDLVPRYSESIQDLSYEPATVAEAGILTKNFNIVISILEGNNKGWTEKIITNGSPSDLLAVKNAYTILLANLDNDYIQDEIIAYIDSLNPGFLDAQPSGNARSKCRRDIEYIVQSIAFDLLHGGNRQSIQSGLLYWGFNGGNTVIPEERTQTVGAFTFLSQTIAAILINPVALSSPTQTKVKQIVGLPLATSAEQTLIFDKTNILNDIITNGPGTYSVMPISLTKTSNASVINAVNIIKTNKEFLVAELLAYLDKTYNEGAFTYDQDQCFRDTGLLVDAVSQDILLGGNSRSIESGLAYWTQGYSYVSGQISTTTAAINYTSAICQQIIANTTVTSITGTVATQVINLFFQYGGDYMPTQAVARNFDIISNIVTNGPTAAPVLYAGGGLVPLTGINGADVRKPATVASVTLISGNRYLVGLNEPTVGFGVNSTLYFGNVYVQPLQDNTVEELSLQYTNSATTWNSRKLDPIGAMGGSLVDGAVISEISPIQSFVYDAYTQVNQGGRGIYVTNNGYAQLVSVFTIFCSVGVQTDNGGIASITNSNNNFGDLCLVAKGYGKRSFSGTVYNPIYTAYPSTPGPDGFNQYYPNGYWPNKGTLEIFVPDTADRPHISLVMEVIPPKRVYDQASESYIDQLNSQGFPGFLSAQPSTSVLTTGTIVLTGIDNSDVSIGNAVYIRDQQGREYDDNDIRYIPEGTIVSDVGYNTITLSKALTSGGGDSTNPIFFTLYFCGNAYYTVLSSTIATDPKPLDVNLLSQEGLTYQNPFTGATVAPEDQVENHKLAISYLSTLVDKVISNIQFTTTYQTNVLQVISPTITGGGQAQAFIDNRFGNIINIVGAANITAAKSVVPSSALKKTGTVPAGAGSAITLIESNTEFLAAEVTAYVDYLTGSFSYNIADFKTNIGLTVDALVNDLLYGGTTETDAIGVDYYDSTSVTVPNSQTQIFNVFDYFKSIVSRIVIGTPITDLYQTKVSQVTSGLNGTGSEALTANTLVNNIAQIILQGAGQVVGTSPTGLTTDPNIINAAQRILDNKNFLKAELSAFVDTNYVYSASGVFNKDKCERDVRVILQRIIYDIQTGGTYNSVYTGLSYWSRKGTYHIVELGEAVTNTSLFPDGATVNFYQRSYISASGYLFEYVGAGTNYGALPQVGRADPVQAKETVQLNNGSVFFTSTDQNGDFRIGRGLVISQATGVLSGRTFTKSLFANMTPFILAIEGG